MTANKITYHEFEPDFRLKDYIKSYWYFCIRTDSVKLFDILPDGYFDLLVIIKDNKIIETQLTGIWSKSISIYYSEDTEVFGIRFKPLSIGGLLKFDIKNFLNDSQFVTLMDFSINEQILLDSLYGFPKFLVNYLNNHFLKLISLKKTDNRLRNCFELIDNSKGNIVVGEVSNMIGLSSRQLHRIVTKMIGIGIKDYSKIVRFKKTLKDVKNNKSNYLQYYDQSHYIREIRHFTGLTPEKLDLNNDRFIQYYNYEPI